MSQNSFIQQYLAKQQELLRQRLEREAREACDTNEQQDHTEVNNSTSCPQDVKPALAEEHRPPGPSGADGLFNTANDREPNRNQDADVSTPASGSVAMRGAGEQQPERRSASSGAVADSDDDDSEDGEEDGDHDVWGGGAGRRSLREPSRPMTRERSGASCQPQQQQQQQQQHMPSLLSPQLRQPTPPPSPPPELSFPLPDTPKQSPPSPDVAPPRRSPSTSSSGSSSSDSRSSSPEPQRSGHAERKPGPLTLLARKMASEDAIFEVGWHGAEGEADRQDSGAPAATAFPSRGPPEGLVSAITHTANTAGHGPYAIYPGTAQALAGSHLAHIQVPVSVLKATETDERDKKGENELERERALQLERQRKQEQAAEEERQKALALQREERERAVEQERIERQLALEKEEREKALQRERELALERERELALARERKEREEMERQKELERQRALEQERLERERERALEQERERVLELERLERERALEQERLERERERLERERALEQERLERERALELERERALEQERLERERALEQERLERERALELDRLEQERLERERIERENALEQERIMRLKALEEERKRALELERLELEKQRIAREQALEQQRLERERALEKERMEREAALEQERMEKERAEQEKLEREKERMARERALEAERREREEALQREEQEREKAKAKMAERERESHLPPSKRGREVGLTPLPTPSPLFTGAGRKPSTEAGEQEDAHAPVSRSEEAESPTPLSPQSSFKKFRILRDSQAQPQSAAAVSPVIKQPLHSSDAPPTQATPLSSSSHSHQPVAEQERTGTGGQTGADDVTGPESEDKPKGGSAQADVAGKEFVKPSKEAGKKQGPPMPEEAAQRRGRDTKREEKQGRQRSSSNDSSSSESDSGSSSSRSSSGSSSSSEEKTGSPPRDRRERKHERDSVPLRRETPEAGVEDLEAGRKAAPRRRETSVDKSDATTDEDTSTGPPKRSIEESTVEEMPKKRQCSDREEDKDKQTPMESDTVEVESEKLQETNEEAPKAFSARKISLSNNKPSPGIGSSEGDQDSGAAAGRKRRWGSSTAVTTKKPSISITTDSLKSLIPDIRPSLGQDAVVDLHPEEAVLSGAEDEERERSDQDLQIRRTVTQVVHAESQENGQKEAKRGKYEEEEDEAQGDEDRTRASEEKVELSPPAAMDTQPPPDTSHHVETNTVTPSDTLIRRSISQQKTGVSITIDDPVRTARQPSPPRGKVSSIVHVSNLVRPFTLGQLKELLGRTGTLVEDGFWIDKIKSHCYVTYCSSEEAVATRAALHGVKWPQSNPKVLRVDFCQQDELDFHKGLVTGDRPGAGAAEEQGAVFGRGRAAVLPPLLPERDQWAEREREMERREKARAEREWDRDKVREFGKPGDEKEGARRSRSRERRRKERGKSKEKKSEKKEKPEDPPAKLLDDLFRKTKAAPCIYWLPLTEEQFAQKEAARAERMKEREKRTKEREKRRKEQEEEEEKKREEERKERMKAGGGEGEKDRDRERDRDRGRERDHDKRRDGYRRPGGSSSGGGGGGGGGGGSGGAGGGRRSRSRSDPRDRRR
ncbi:uncharacterized protein acin1a isoform X2 [Nelusetta ayraudi]|uniref:uncharacterized protein acin1a isoform X2 n=1 Tax=Nelusetta ayraudi TaxID=303726 RepID=UPI003F6F9E26